MKITYGDILRENKKLAASLGGDSYEIKIIQNIMTPTINAILEYGLRSQDINAQVTSGDYDNLVQDSQACEGAKAVIVFWELCNVVDGGQYRINLMESNELEDLAQKIEAEIDLVLANLENTSLVLFNRFTAMAFTHYFLRPTEMDLLANRLNSYLQTQAGPNLVLVDLEKIFAALSVEKSIDFRGYYSSKLLYTTDFFRSYAEFTRPVILAAMGRSKKALFLDCDNTLWKGVLGEEGFDGIKMSGKYGGEGAPFEEVQGLAISLAKRGIILGLCSKNNHDDVNRVLADHPDMLLRDEHLVIKAVNWENKATNLSNSVDNLNIGMDSIVFLDDSPFEANFVREALPQVTVLEVPDPAYKYPAEFRRNMDLFYTLSEAAEDAKKIEMYKSQAARNEARRSFVSIDDFLEALGLEMVVYKDDPSQTGRISQMTQKTNQFNLTTKRYTEGDISRFFKDSNCMVYSFSVADKFGEYGITGLCILNIDGASAHIDTFLMSCRVIGRNLEIAFFDTIVNELKKSEVIQLEAAYFRTPKNGQVADLWDRIGFDRVGGDEGTSLYSVKLDSYDTHNLDYIRVSYGN